MTLRQGEPVSLTPHAVLPHPYRYTFTRWNLNPGNFIKCPTVIQNQGCVFTLDYKYDAPYYQLKSESFPITNAAMYLARECVRNGGVDGGNVTWTGLGYGGRGTIWIWLSHRPMPRGGTYAKITNSEDRTGTLHMVDTI